MRRLGGVLNALGPLLIGVIRDATGGYTAALLVCMGLKIAAAVGIMTGKRSLSQQSRDRAGREE